MNQIHYYQSLRNSSPPDFSLFWTNKSKRVAYSKKMNVLSWKEKLTNKKMLTTQRELYKLGTHERNHNLRKFVPYRLTKTVFCPKLIVPTFKTVWPICYMVLSQTKPIADGNNSLKQYSVYKFSHFKISTPHYRGVLQKMIVKGSIFSNCHYFIGNGQFQSQFITF